MIVRPRGLFVGVTSIDIVHLVDRLPAPNEKRPALDLLATTGGPVTSAAVTFAWLGGDAHVVSALGRHPLAAIARADLAASGVRHTDLAPDHAAPPHTCSVLVTAGTGDRAVVYRALPAVDAASVDATAWLDAVDVVLVDGHQLPLSVALARAARARGVPVVLDAGSWRDGLGDLLALVDDAVCAETFHPPGCQSVGDVMRDLATRGVLHRVVTRGPRSVLYESADDSGEIAVPVVDRVVDTLGAGDIFHGAYCFHRIRGVGASPPGRGQTGGGVDDGHAFRNALTRAAALASRSCASFGPRAWMDSEPVGWPVGAG